jgi:hypothetical protein
MKECPVCSKPFTPATRNQVYCGADCREAFYGRAPDGTPGAAVAAQGRLLVAADLARRGWLVYAPLTPGCRSDLVIENGRRRLGVKVVVGFVGAGGEARSHRKARGPSEYRAIYCPANARIAYEPDLPAAEPFARA